MLEEYFAMDASVPGYTRPTMFYAADVMLVPAISVLLLLLLGLGLHVALTNAINSEDGTRQVRVGLGVILAVGIVATTLGSVSLFTRLPIIQDNFLVSPSVTGMALWLSPTESGIGATCLTRVYPNHVSIRFTAGNGSCLPRSEPCRHRWHFRSCKAAPPVRHKSVHGDEGGPYPKNESCISENQRHVQTRALGPICSLRVGNIRAFNADKPVGI